MRIIAIANQKGGCGKTTTAINLSASLAFLGKKTLLVDLDPQGHSTLGLGYNVENFNRSLYDVLSPHENQISLEEVILQVNSNHHLVPSHVILSAIEQQLAGVYGREEKLMEKLRTVQSHYDFVIIDCPPNLGLLTFNALRASEELLIPVEPSYFSIQGLKKIRETVNLIEETLKHRISTHALLTLFNSRSNFNQKILSELQQFFKDQLLRTVINQNVRLKEAAEVGKSICDFDRKSTGFRDYMSLASELIERGSVRKLVEEYRVAEPEPEINVEVSFNEARAEIADSFNVPVEQVIEPSKPILKFPMTLTDGVILGYNDPSAKLVQVAGDFNNWVNEAMEPTDSQNGVWEKFIPLAPGRYRYKFIVDGDWSIDPKNEVTEPNPYGGIDSVIVIARMPEEILNERSSTKIQI